MENERQFREASSSVIQDGDETRGKQILHGAVPQEYQEIDLKLDVIGNFDERNEDALPELISLGNLGTRIMVKGAASTLVPLVQKSAATKLMGESLPAQMSIPQQTDSVQRWLPVLLKHPLVLDPLLHKELQLVSSTIEAIFRPTKSVGHPSAEVYCWRSSFPVPPEQTRPALP